MTITKKQWMMLLLGAGVLFLVYWFFFRKKNTESSYDEDLMIFGNENGYTNDELDGGSYGYESGLTGKDGQNIQVQKTSGKCDCDKAATGICFKSEKGTLGCTSSTLAPASTAGRTKSLRQRCRDAGGIMGTCYKNGSNAGYPCCSMQTAAFTASL
jgi:hypothetical protein